MYNYKQSFIINLITSLLGILLGVLLIFSDAEKLLQLVFGAIAIYLFFLAIPSLIFISKEENSKEKTKIITISITMIVIGTILLIYPTTIATIIAGTFLLIIPIYNIVTSKDKKFALKKELVKLILGLVLILCGVGSIVQVVLYIIGGLIVLVSLYYLIYNIVIYFRNIRKHKRFNEENEVIDV